MKNNVFSNFKIHNKHDLMSTSLLFFDPEKIFQNVDVFTTNFPGSVAWAVKSNPHPEVVAAIIKAGIVNFDVASRSEIELINSQTEGAKLHFNHPVKSVRDIEYALCQADVRIFVVDCIEELAKIDKIVREKCKFPPSEIVIHVRFCSLEKSKNSNYCFDRKFGAPPLSAIEILKACHKLGYKVGISFHPGSQTESPSTYRQLMEIAYEIATAGLGQSITELVSVNVGGGFPIEYNSKVPELSNYFMEIAEMAKKFPCEISCEPGRALVGNSIQLLTEIILRKGNDNRLYINDGIYGSLMELKFVNFFPRITAYDPFGNEMTGRDGGFEPYEIWGATCDSLDGFAQKVLLPVGISTGCFLVFDNVGAYSSATKTNFNGIKTGNYLMKSTSQKMEVVE